MNFFSLDNNFLNILWDFQPIKWQRCATSAMILCRDAMCSLGLTCLLIISFSFLYEGQGKAVLGLTPLCTLFNIFFLSSQTSKTSIPSEDVYDTSGETVLFCWLWRREKCPSLSLLGLKMFKMFNCRFTNIKSCQASPFAFCCYYTASEWFYSQH